MSGPPTNELAFVLSAFIGVHRRPNTQSVICFLAAMLLVKVTNQQFLKRPWLFAIYTVMGGAWLIYFGGPKAQGIEVIAIAVSVVAVVNVWFYLSLRQTLRDQKH
jgi:hypothetical protein